MQSEDTWMELHVLHRHGWSIAALAREFGLDWRTARRYAEAGAPPRYRPRSRPAELSAAQLAHVERRLAACPDLRVTVLLRELRERLRLRRQLHEPPPAGGALRPADHGRARAALRDGSRHPDPGRLGRLRHLAPGRWQRRAPRVGGGPRLQPDAGRPLRDRQDAPDHPARDRAQHRRPRWRDRGVPDDRDTALVNGARSDGCPSTRPSGSTPRRCWAPAQRACRPYRAKTKGKVERVIREVKEDFLAWLAGPGAAGTADARRVRRRRPALGARGGGHASPPDHRADRRRGVGPRSGAPDAGGRGASWSRVEGLEILAPVTAPSRPPACSRRRDRRGPAAGRLRGARPMSTARRVPGRHRLCPDARAPRLPRPDHGLGAPGAELERAKDERSAPVEVLDRLLAAEVGATVARRLSGRLRFAHYPLPSIWSTSSSTSNRPSTGR